MTRGNLYTLGSLVCFLAVINVTGFSLLSGTSINIHETVGAEVEITVDNTLDHSKVAKPIRAAKSRHDPINSGLEGRNILSPKKISKNPNKNYLQKSQSEKSGEKSGICFHNIL